MELGLRAFETALRFDIHCGPHLQGEREAQ